MEPIFFKTKKNPHPNWALVATQKVSAQNNEVSSFARGKTYGRFWVLGPQKPLEGGIWKFCVYDNFCSTHQGLSTLRVLKFFAQPFVRNAGKGGCPLKGTPPPFLTRKKFFFDSSIFISKGVSRCALSVL